MRHAGPLIAAQETSRSTSGGAVSIVSSAAFSLGPPRQQSGLLLSRVVLNRLIPSDPPCHLTSLGLPLSGEVHCMLRVTGDRSYAVLCILDNASRILLLLLTSSYTSLTDGRVH